MLIRSDAVSEQLAQVVAECALEVGSCCFSRCALCNVLVEPMAREAARDLVPPYVWRTQSQFVRCPECGRVYWDGTHRRNMRTLFARLNGVAGAP